MKGRLRSRPGGLAAVLGLVATVATAGCITHRGPDWSTQAPPPAAREGASLVLLGGAGSPGRAAAQVAARVRAIARDERSAGRTPIFVWLGDNVAPVAGRGPDCPERGQAWTRPGVAELVAAVQAERDAGARSYAVPGPHDWACGFGPGTVDDDPATPWTMPAANYVVRVERSGASRVVSTCDARSCAIEASDDTAAFDLVMVDLSRWFFPEVARPHAITVAQAELAALLAAIAVTPGPPRVLVSHVPLEGAGYFGHGGGTPVATYHNFPRALRDAIAHGTFVGVLGALDRSTYAVDDVGDAVIRSDRVFIDHPVFEVVTGTASAPWARSARLGPRLRYFTSDAFVPPAYTMHPGFAVVRVEAERVTAVLHARVRRQWKTATLAATMRPELYPAARRVPSTAPCLRCPAVPHSER